MKRTYIIITKFPVGSGIENTKETLVRKVTLSTEDEEFKESFDDFEKYVSYCLDEECGGDEQHWGTCVVLTEEEFKIVKEFEI